MERSFSQAVINLVDESGHVRRLSRHGIKTFRPEALRPRLSNGFASIV